MLDQTKFIDMDLAEILHLMLQPVKLERVLTAWLASWLKHGPKGDSQQAS